MNTRTEKACVLVGIIFFLIGVWSYDPFGWVHPTVAARHEFASLLAFMTTFPVFLLFGAVTSAIGVSMDEPRLGTVLPLTISAISGLVWATGCRLALSRRPTGRKALRGLLIFAFLLCLAPLACWWTSSPACPARVRYFATWQAEFCLDYLYPGRGERGTPTESAYLVDPPVRREISVAVLTMAVSNAIFGAVVLSVTVWLVYRYLLAISRGP